MLIHQDASNAAVYDCKFCSYKTTLKIYLTKHFTTNHGHIYEVITYTCKFCSYKTKRKEDLSNHVLVHHDASEDAESAQNLQESTREYDEPERCLDIKAEELDIKKEEDECD
ncbi:hypothetical protein NQ318_000635, partial [Aromia moschata]